MSKFLHEDTKLDFSDVLLVPKYSGNENLTSRSQVILEKEFKFSCGHIWKGIPIIATNMSTIGTFRVHEVLSKYNMLTALHKHYNLDQWKLHTANSNRNNMLLSIGGKDDDINFLDSIMQHTPVSMIRVDVANGYLDFFAKHIEKIRSKYPNLAIFAGNIVTEQGAKKLINAGADCIFAGIGGGSACSTRIQTGSGYPQLSVILEIANICYSSNVYCVSDGGITCPGDLAKAYAAGADFVAIGGYFAGHDETGTKFYGMSSSTAMNKFNNGVSDYRSSEGHTIEIKESKGKLDDCIKDMLGGLRSALTYQGVDNLDNFYKESKFVKVNNQYNKMYYK